MAKPTNLDLAREQLARVQTAAIDPVDWSDVSVYGLYALENAVVAAAGYFMVSWSKTHPSKVDAAEVLHEKHGLPDISSLLAELNTLRKGESYGEYYDPPSLTAEEIATQIEAYVDAVTRATSSSS